MAKKGGGRSGAGQDVSEENPLRPGEKEDTSLGMASSTASNFHLAMTS